MNTCRHIILLSVSQRLGFGTGLVLLILAFALLVTSIYRKILIRRRIQKIRSRKVVMNKKTRKRN